MSQQSYIAATTAIALLLTTNTLAAPLVSSAIFNTRGDNPSCAPGGNFDLGTFDLQLPTGSSGKVDQISSTKLSGCDGWSSRSTFSPLHPVHLS